MDNSANEQLEPSIDLKGSSYSESRHETKEESCDVPQYATAGAISYSESEPDIALSVIEENHKVPMKHTAFISSQEGGTSVEKNHQDVENVDNSVNGDVPLDDGQVEYLEDESTTDNNNEMIDSKIAAANDTKTLDVLRKPSEEPVQNEKAVYSINNSCSNTILHILNTDQAINIKVSSLIDLIKTQEIESDILFIDSILYLLVNGPFDMEQNFVIHSPESVLAMLDVMTVCSLKMKAQLWSVFIAILRKSKRNLMVCCEASLIERVLHLLPESDDMVSDLLIELLGILASFSITVKDLKLLFQLLQAQGGKWPRHSVKLLTVLQQMPVRHGPDEFFSFPGQKGSAIAIPPISKWPHQNGWTFNCWFHLDPVSGSHIEREKPYLYCFRTSKGVGYSGHFLGNALVVTSMKVKGKGFQHCVRYEFQPRKWYMVTIVHVYNRWSRSEIRCYVDGQLVSQAEMSWPVSTSDPFDRCFIGSKPEQEQDSMFSGLVSSVYGFNESISPQQIQAIYALGPAYKGQFKFESESAGQLNDSQRKALYEGGRLAGSVMFIYNPVACDRQLCLDQSPRANPSVFSHSPHALMMGDVKPVLTQSIHSTLHSLGGVQVFYPLFSQLDCLHLTTQGCSETPMFRIAALLITVVFELVRSSPAIRQLFIQTRGLLLIGHYLELSSPGHINAEVLESLLAACRSHRISAPATTASGGAGLTSGAAPSQAPVGLHDLLKQMYDFVLNNPGLWIRAPVEVQNRLYHFLATEFLGDAFAISNIRRVNAVIQAMHTLKYYYWIVHPRNRSGFLPKTPDVCPRPDLVQLAKIRANILMYVKQLVLRGTGIQDDELQAILNYLTTVNEDDNLRDVLYFTVLLMAEQPSSLVPAFDRKQGIRSIFKLLASEDESIRIQALKLLGFYLMRSTQKRKQDTMHPNNLFSLIGERLLLYSSHLTVATYNVLFAIMTEKLTISVAPTRHDEPDASYRLENPLLLKVIGHLIRHSKQTSELHEVRKLFLSDLTALCTHSKDNRRTVLQMSVWQDWMFSLAPVYPRGADEERITLAVMALFRMLLHHAVKYEYGGWRVWIDTLAILHTKVAYEEFRRRMTQVYEQYEQQRIDMGSDRGQFQPGRVTAGSEVDLAESVAREIVEGVLEAAMGQGEEHECQRCEHQHQAENSRPRISRSHSQNSPSRPVNMAAPAQTQDRARRQSFHGPGGGDGGGGPGRIFSPGPCPPPFRIPEFSWSYLHQKLLNDLLYSIETDLHIWKSQGTRNILDFINAPENHVYVINLIHLISQLSDSLVTSCGGLLPLLAAATSPTGEVDMLESGHGMKMERAVSFLLRVMNLSDLVVFASAQNFAELEQEKNMAAGGILRQCLRLVCTCAVRNCLECRYRQLFGNSALGVGSGISLMRSGGASHHVQEEEEEEEEDEEEEESGSEEEAEGEQESDHVQGEVGDCGDGAQTARRGAHHKQRPGIALGDRNLHMLPDPVKELIRGLRPFSGQSLVDKLQAQNSSIRDAEMLLQEMDINRLRAVVYRDVEETKQAQFLALAILYFLSVLMVSKYRDLLEPIGTPLATTPGGGSVRSGSIGGATKGVASSSGGGTDGVTASTSSPTVSASALAVREVAARDRGDSETVTSSEATDDASSSSQATEAAGDSSNSGPGMSPGVDGSSLTAVPVAVLSGAMHEVREQDGGGITSIQIASTEPPTSVPHPADTRPASLPLPFSPQVPPPGSRYHPAGADLTERLERALGSAAPLLREIFIDFANFLSKTLLGSHGQELLAGGLVALRQSSSVVELVMLLCSQEWQNSLQKNAGLAFIELVNEGRLLSHATRDHIVRVAHEAEFILNRMRAEDVQRHSEFEQQCGHTMAERREEERLCDHLICSARQRDRAVAARLRDKVASFMTNQHGPWGSRTNRKVEFDRLDVWEDDSRRRRRLVPNPLGSSHPEAKLISHLMKREGAGSAVEESDGAGMAGTDPATQLRLKSALRLTGAPGTGGEEPSHGITDEELMEGSGPSGPGQGQAVGQAGMTGAGRGEDASGAGAVAGGPPSAAQIEVDLEGPVALSTRCILLAPGAVVHGTMSVTKLELCFEMDPEEEENKRLDDKVLNYVDHIHGKWHFSEIRAIFSRRYLHKNVALEIFVANRSAIMFAFPDQTTVRKVVQCLPRVGIGVKYNLPQTRKSSLAAPRQIFKLSNMTQRWQRREISNFDYLMYLNTVAGRTFNDLNQYPIFPWVLSNYESADLDLSCPANYRDLSKPIGALNPSRRAFFDERYSNWDDDSQPAFHYGTHYSTAAFVLNYLVRLEPFTTLFLNLQGGKFDHADRSFHSASQTWKNCQRDTSDVKELIPEFFYLPEMLENTNRYHLGVLEDGTDVDNVFLPPWAKTPEDFIRINRQALESEFVSCQLHQWIDLIFGYKQRGPEAVRATNVFCHLTYEGSVDWSQVTDAVMRRALEDQIRGFGQTPSQLLTEPHPPRNSALHVSPMMFCPLYEDVCMIMKFVSNSAIEMVAANTHPASPLPAVVTVAANHIYAVNKWNNTAAESTRKNAAMQQQQSSSSLATGAGSSGGAVGGAGGGISSSGLGTGDQPAPQLPLSMDPHLAQPGQSSKRYLGDNYDQRLRVCSVQFATTPDNRILFACGYWDKSFRVYSLDTGRILQVVYGHFGVVTCLARSECNLSQDCYVVTGSTDCTVLLWLWSSRQQAIVGDGTGGSGTGADCPVPRVTLTGHHDEVSCVLASAELGIIVSGSKEGLCLIHTTQGELLRSLARPPNCHSPSQTHFTREGYICLLFDCATLALYTINGKLLTWTTTSAVVSGAGSSGVIHAVVLSRCGGYLLAAGESGSVRVLRVHDLAPLYALPTCDAAVRSLAITHDQRFVLAGLSSGCLVVFNIDFNRWHHEFQERYPS